MTKIIGNFVLYKILQAYSMLLINVLVEAVLGVSMTYAITVGKVEANESRSMLPEALQTKTSICPGVSTSMWFIGFASGLTGSGAVLFSRRFNI
jgi:hypothetical protein